MTYPNPFLDWSLTVDKNKDKCGKCWQLDRINNRCDKYGKELVGSVKTGMLFSVFEKCDECKNAK